MKKNGYDTIKSYETTYDLVPICKDIYADSLTPVNILRRLKTVSKEVYLLESVEGGKQIGRYSFLGYDPLIHVYADEDSVTVESNGSKNILKENPLQALKDMLKQYRSPKIEGMPPFTGGFVGYFAYNFFRLAEPKLKLKPSEFNLYNLMLFDKVIAFDHLKQKIVLIANVDLKQKEVGYEKAKEKLEEMTTLIHDTSPLPKSIVRQTPEFRCNVTKEEYCKMVEKTKQYIYEGDIFQAVISRKFEAVYEESLLNTYRVMRTINPSPYMYYIESKDTQIAGVSPETLVKLVDGKLTTFPVAGTRKRGETQQEDQELEAELLADEKELAEHNMLVDLARNDLSRIATYGSVNVSKYMEIHRFSKVMHIASTVEGQIKDGKDGVDTVATMLPAGTLSGAPKIRACEIIDELEPTSRGVYGGAIGYLDLSGNMDVCIAIRTAVKKGNHLSIQAGAGVVADSIPENEYEETKNKAKAVIEAVLRASEVNEA